MLPGILRLPEVFCVLGFSSRHTIASDLANSNTPFQKKIFLGKHSHIILRFVSSCVAEAQFSLLPKIAKFLSQIRLSQRCRPIGTRGRA